MPQAAQYRNGRQRSRSHEEEYVVFFQGIPPQCRWQELKDLVRQTALHIRQSVVYDDPHGNPTGLGQIIIKNHDEAWRTYDRLSTNGWNGHSLTITLALANAPTTPIAGPTRSPPLQRMPFVPANLAPPVMTSPTCSIGHDVSLSPVYPQPPEYHPFASHLGHPHLVPLHADALAYQIPMMVPNDNTILFPHFYHPSFTPHTMAPLHHYPPPRPMHPFPQSKRSSISTNSNYSIGSNAEVIAPHSRHLFIQNLSPGTTSQQLKDYFQIAGVVDACEVLDQRSFGRAKFCATVSFRSEEEARGAISMFDSSVFMGSRIKVRFNRERSGSYSSQSRQAAPVDDTRVPRQSQTPELVSSPDSIDTAAVELVSPSDEELSPGTRSSEPLVVNGSSSGMRTGRANGEAHRGDAGELPRLIREAHL
ncbi:hypothetical protein LOZ36_005254 [Ophidiomyces ophidiicola]|nr:hypothetical protein LOZ36_005254 [Ophidiomyces ophidiicola]